MAPPSETQNKTAYYAQILTEQADWLGTVFIELDSIAFNDLIDRPVVQEAGYTVLLTRTGQVIANPSAAETTSTATYQSIPELGAVWSQMMGESGILEGEEGYWSYEQIPEREWIVVSFVPYNAVFNRVALITVGGTLAVGLALALVVALSVRSLNRRLRPMLDECYRLAGTDAEGVAPQQDEVEQISTAFFNALEQIKLDQEQIQQDLVQRVQTEEQLKQMAIAEQSNQVLQTEVEKILTMVSAIEAGDLTVEAQSGTGATGSITNTLNRLVERLGYIIAIVLNTTERVAQGADHLEQVAIAVSDNAEQQTESVIQVQNLIETVDGLSQEATQQVSATSEAVQLTQTATRQGQREVTTIFEGIGSLQQNTNQISKRVEMLTSYVELAAQFAKDQKRIASMTRILAVNASMLANRAAVQQDPQQFASITREFETVAAQVDDLASQTNQSLILLQQRTDQIQTTVSGLDYDVQEISQQVSDFTVGVDQSLQVLNTIQTANEQVDQTWQQVVQSNRAIANAVQTALQSVRTIAAIAVETSNQANLTKDQTHQIEQLAQTLLRTVDFFKLRPSPIYSQNSSEVPLPRPPHSQTRQTNDHSSLEESHSKNCKRYSKLVIMTISDADPLKDPETFAEAQLQQELRILFIVDTQDCLQRYSHIAKQLHAQSWTQDVRELYRCIHTIKGGAVTVTAEAILKVATVIEDLLSDLRYLDSAPSLADGYLQQTLLETGELLASTLNVSGSEDAGAQIAPILTRIQVLHKQVRERYLPTWNEQKQLHQEFADQGFDMIVLDLEIALEQAPSQGTVLEMTRTLAQQTLTQLQQVGQDLQFAAGWTQLLNQAQQLFDHPENLIWRSQWPLLFHTLKTCAKQSGAPVPFELNWTNVPEEVEEWNVEERSPSEVANSELTFASSEFESLAFLDEPEQTDSLTKTSHFLDDFNLIEGLTVEEDSLDFLSPAVHQTETALQDAGNFLDGLGEESSLLDEFESESNLDESDWIEEVAIAPPPPPSPLPSRHPPLIHLTYSTSRLI
ncbi:MAG: hypothetical protein HC840_19170 [Leptolyngbyaceae cyanobacterium RM2_2_4]|nr:hypothetical protein [Leptolyngbyaceae cyanobacterium RM2_2_4]